MIRLDVSVVDAVGRAVAGLRAEDFEVREDGRRVPLVHFEAIGSLPGADEAQAAVLGEATPERRGAAAGGPGDDVARPGDRALGRASRAF